MSGMTSVSFNRDFLLETVDLALEFVSDILVNLQEIEISHSRNEYFLNMRIAQAAEQIGRHVEITSLLSKTILTKTGTSLPEIKDSQIQLLFTLKSIDDARLKQDYVALEELIKHELNDNLTRWKIDLIPQLKKLLTT